MTDNRVQSAPVLRFKTPATASPEAAEVLTAVYGASRETPQPPKPVSQADFDAANLQMNAVFAPSNQAIVSRLGTTMRRDVLGGVPVLRLLPRRLQPSGRAIVYVHGGAYIYFSAETLVGLPALIVEATGCEVISIDYTLAPRARWQAVTDEVLAVWTALIASGCKAGSLGLMGDSAGGGLASGAVLKMRDEGLPLPGALWLISPWSDISGAGDTYETLADVDPVLAPEVLDWGARAYAEPEDQRHPYVSPVYCDYSGPFPATLIQGGTREMFLSNFVRHYQAIRNGGHEAVLDLYEAMPHVFQSLAPEAPESLIAIARAAAFFDQHLHR